jgi:hypothetical protein
MSYAVRFMRLDSIGHTQTDSSGPWDYLSNAYKRRNELFKGDATIARCWIDRIVEGGRPIARHGAVLKREAATA